MKQTVFTFSLAIALGILVLLPAAISSCNNQPQNNTDSSLTGLSDNSKKGAALAKQYCQSCHLLPHPSLLDKNSWATGVLPAMGPHLGIFVYDTMRYPSQKNDPALDKNYYPSQPLIGFAEWQQILDYYTEAAPDKLPAQPPHDSIVLDLPGFKVATPAVNAPAPGIAYVKINNQKLYSFDIITSKLVQYNSQLQSINAVNTRSTIVDINMTADKWVGCNIGMLNPSNGKFGDLRFLNWNNTKTQLTEDTFSLTTKLARPVQIAAADFNKDGKEDYAVCEFGYLTGALSWLEAKGDKQFEHHVIKAVPGAIKIITDDYNKDGLTDLWVLFAQADEGISLFTNQGNGKFAEERVLRVPSVYGSTNFEFADFNKDGFKDIVLACGDNADYSIILKPYHGVYVYLNNGKNQFTQQYFYPINGCYKALPNDYDNDGDIDIATIAFFADYETQPQEGFVYLENKGNWKFTPRTVEAAKKGRWLTMDAGDIDGDNKIDIVLGNFSIRPSSTPPKYDWQKGPAVLLLKNISK